MTDYSKLVKALRCCCPQPEETCDGCPYDTAGECNISRMMFDAADAIEELQAEVDRLKDSNEELREKQTYADHNGDKWRTSGKDIVQAAYDHGYMDGWDEARAKMEVQDG